MKKELKFFMIEEDYGFQQDRFLDPMMKLGGCAAVTACDASIYFDLYWGTHLYPYDVHALSRRDYVRFSKQMKPYLKPRRGGVSRLELYIDGYGQYLRDRGEQRIWMRGLSGTRPANEAWQALKKQIDRGIPVPCLILKHKNPAYDDYVWHWFMLTGYEETPRTEAHLVKAVTYGTWNWIDFDGLWNTGEEERGGLILFERKAADSIASPAVQRKRE